MYSSHDDSGLGKIVSLLRQHKTRYLSGQEISNELKISRVAVWKHIKKIKTLGYKIDSKKNHGYILDGTTKLLLPWEIQSGLKTKFIGKYVYYFDKIDSTQNFASKISGNNVNGTIVVSSQQTKGRGRSGRTWLSPKGGIWISIVLYPEFDISKTTLFPIASSLALAIAIEKTLKIKPELKWPNDLTLDGKKIAGMLVDISMESNKIENLILGVGINFEINTKAIEKRLKGTENFYGVTSLLKNNQSGNPVKLVQSFLTELEIIYENLKQQKTRPIINQWTKRSATIGHNVTIRTHNSKIVGKAIRIDVDGALVIRKKGKLCRVLVGDVDAN